MATQQIYNLKQHARALAALVDLDHNRFIAGTSSIRNMNEIHIVESPEGREDAVCRMVCEHPSEIWDISPCSFDPSLVFTTHSTEGASFGCTLWKLPPIEDSTEVQNSSNLKTMTSLATVPISSRRVNNVVWNPQGKSPKNSFIVVEEHHFSVWNMAASSSELKEESKVWCQGREAITKGFWDPHPPHLVMTCAGNIIDAWDLRTARKSLSISNAHQGKVFDLDFNPNKQNMIVTGGDDSKIKFWDLRKVGPTPVLAVVAHDHWVTSVRYNGLHDQLLMSCGTDHCSRLWNIASLKSAPADQEENDSQHIEDSLVLTLKSHQESVQKVVWSVCDGWTFASLSYDGRLVIDSVPSTTKYKILL